MYQQEINRREFVCRSMAGASLALAPQVETNAKDEDGSRHKLFWGDLHNHNAVGYGIGSLQRSIDLARGHLDFFAFTGHASWHDIPKIRGNRQMKWINGFKAHRDHWPKTRQLIREANTDDFVAFLGYEWHSSRFGDYCMIFPEDQPELFLPDHVDKLLDFAEAHHALAIPHHVSYRRGFRGTDFNFFRPSVSPIVEVYSEHGCSMEDEAPFRYIRHSHGGRSTENTIEYQLAQKRRFGFVASSDNHRGYPGAYGEGVLGVWARELSPQALFEAFRARRTYASTGARIALEFTLNGRPMGSELAETTDREIDIRVEAQDAIDSIEVIRNGRVIERRFPKDAAEESAALPGIVKCRFQYGWGPWAALALGRICPWDVNLRVQGGRLLGVVPCFQSGPFNEELRDKLQMVSPTELRLESNTARDKCFAQDPTKSLVFHLEGDAETELTLTLRAPVQKTIKRKLQDLLRTNDVLATGGIFDETCILHRLVGPQEYQATFRVAEKRTSQPGGDWYYVRLTQQDGQMAWSSPIWVG